MKLRRKPGPGNAYACRLDARSHRGKAGRAERKAFMNKVQASAAYHGITLEELEQGLPDGTER